MYCSRGRGSILLLYKDLNMEQIVELCLGGIKRDGKLGRSSAMRPRLD